MEHEFISIASVSGAQGLQGQLKVFPLSDHPNRFRGLPGKDIIWKRGEETRVVHIEAVRPMGRFFILTLSGVTERSQAIELVGGDLVVLQSEVLPLPEGSFYIYELLGLRVYDEQHGFLGVVSDVLQPGSNDVYVVKGPRGEVLIPALKDCIRTIDVSRGAMEVSLPEGLLDAHED